MNSSLWRDKVHALALKSANIAYEWNDDGVLRGDELGLRSPSSDSVIRMHSNGTIDIFSKSMLGMRIDAENDAVCIFAPNLYMYTDSAHVFTTNLAGFTWNKLAFNPGATIPETPALMPPGANELADKLSKFGQEILALFMK